MITLLPDAYVRTMRSLWTFATIVTAVAALQSCAEGAPTTAPLGPVRAPVHLSLDAMISGSGRSIKVVGRYARESAPAVMIAFDSATVVLASADTQATAHLNISACLSDPARETEAGATGTSPSRTCVIHLEVLLLDAGAQVIDEADLAPIVAQPGADIHPQPISLGVHVGSVTVSPHAVVINAIGYSTMLSTIVIDTRSRAVTGAVAVSYTALDTTIASVDADGRVSARATGTTRVIATAHDRSDTATVTVRQVAKTIGVSASALTMFVGDSTDVRYSVLDSAGVAIPAAALTLSWSSARPDVASIVQDVSGIHIAGQSPGSAVITATDGRQSASLTVSVNPAPIVTSLQRFIYGAPILDSLAPSSFPRGGAYYALVRGSGLSNISTVSFSDTSVTASFAARSDTLVRLLLKSSVVPDGDSLHSALPNVAIRFRRANGKLLQSAVNSIDVVLGPPSRIELAVANGITSVPAGQTVTIDYFAEVWSAGNVRYPFVGAARTDTLIWGPLGGDPDAFHWTQHVTIRVTLPATTTGAWGFSYGTSTNDGRVSFKEIDLPIVSASTPARTPIAEVGRGLETSLPPSCAFPRSAGAPALPYIPACPTAPASTVRVSATSLPRTLDSSPHP